MVADGAITASVHVCVCVCVCVCVFVCARMCLSEVKQAEVASYRFVCGGENAVRDRSAGVK